MRQDDSLSETGPQPAALLFGLGLVAGCAVVCWLAWGYRIGTPRRMGPGFFPFFLGLGGIALGAVLAWRGARGQAEPGQAPPIRRLAFISAAFAFFALAIVPLGLLPTLFVTTLIASYADAEARALPTLLLALGLTAGIWAVFILGLGATVPLWPRGL